MEKDEKHRVIHRRYWVLSAIVLAGCSTSPVRVQMAKSSQDLWRAYKANPNTHPNIPNASYAGYRYSEVPLPKGGRRVVNVRTCGAAGDGTHDDTDAFKAAIERVKRQGGGVVFVPGGQYRVARIILGDSGLVLRGEGPEKTVLIFEKSLSEVQGPRVGREGESEYSWSDGLIQIGPAFDDDNRYGWSRDGKGLARVTQPAKRGDLEIVVQDSSALREGQRVFLAWTSPKDHSLVKHIVGSPIMAAFPWERTDFRDETTMLWPVEISKVRGGNRVVLRQPLRLDIRPEWKVMVRANERFVEEVGIEDLRIRMISGDAQPHHLEKGFNGIFFHRVLNSWAKNISIENADNGVLLESTKNITVQGLHLMGERRFHHGTYSKNSHDCLFEDFEINAPVIHGINADILNSGIVWRRGKMKHGTFDLHHGMSFDLIRTDIDVHNDGRRGGSVAFGPIQGARAVHWNVRASGRSGLVYQPDVMFVGALVGIQGVDLDPTPYPGNFVEGDKGSIVADDQCVPDPKDLFQAELELRLNRRKK